MTRRTKRRLLLSLFVFGLLMLAVTGWALQGVRFALGGRPVAAT